MEASQDILQEQLEESFLDRGAKAKVCTLPYTALSYRIKQLLESKPK